jgi:hypothetical protein
MARAARAEIVAAEFLSQLDIAMYDAETALDVGFGGERFATFA